MSKNKDKFIDEQEQESMQEHNVSDKDSYLEYKHSLRIKEEKQYQEYLEWYNKQKKDENS